MIILPYIRYFKQLTDFLHLPSNGYGYDPGDEKGGSTSRSTSADTP